MKFGYRDNHTHAKWEIDYPTIKCTCVDYFYIDEEEIEIVTKSKARCSKQDKFNKEFGMALSNVRCRQKANRKIEKLLIQYSNRNSEKKKSIYDYHKTVPASHYELGEPIIKMESFMDYLVVYTKNKISFFSMENDALINKGVISNER